MKGVSDSGLVRNLLHLGALCSLGIAQPYFGPIGDGPDFFLTNGATRLDIVLLALGLVLLPPLFLFACEALVGLAGAQARTWLHLVFVGGLVALIAWQAIHDSALPSKAEFALAGLAGIAAAALYSGAEPVRTFLTVLSPVPVVVLVVFLGFTPVRTLVFGGDGDAPAKGVRATAPVVMLIIDELPTSSLIDGRGRIDARNYPGFARLAKSSTWYSNETTVADYTQNAVPALLTGSRPRPGTLQVAAEYPRNLFTLLGGAWHVDATEAVTDLCGAACPDKVRAPLTRRMRSMGAQLLRTIPALPLGPRARMARFVQPPDSAPPQATPTRENVRRHMLASELQRFDRFLSTLGQRQSKPTFNFLHLELPHRPWDYAPSGQTYASPRVPNARTFLPMPRNSRSVDVAWQRHLIQTQFTDRLLSRMIDRLRQTGLWDQALVVVTADHGTAFLPGQESRVVTRANIGEIAPVPLFVKAPGQRAGRTEESPTESIDVMPEVARELGVRIPWKVEGTPLSQAEPSGDVSVMRQEDGKTVTVPRGQVLQASAAAVRRRLRAFPGGDPFALGPKPELRGRTSQGLAPLSVSLDPPGSARRVEPRSESLPLDVSGVVRGAKARERPIAVAVDGRVAATGFTTVSPGETESFSVLIPPSALPVGRHRVTVLSLQARR